MKILFLSCSTLQFNVHTPRTAPLGGTESAVCYLSIELAARGHEIVLMRAADHVVDDTVIDGVRHLGVKEEVEGFEPDVVIITSAPQAAPGVKRVFPGAKIILWNHMQPDQPAVQPLFDATIQQYLDDIVYVHETQRAMYVERVKNEPPSCLSFPDHGTIMENAIAPAFEFLFSSKDELIAAKEFKGAYTSTPFRGLSILASIKEIPIEVFSSMQVYQMGDEAYQTMYQRLRENDLISLKGSVSQTTLRELLKPCILLVYPCIFRECHSIAILEAMAAGLKVVTTDLAHPGDRYVDAIPSKGASLEHYCDVLRQHITQYRSRPEFFFDDLWQQVQYVNKHFRWSQRALQWENYLQSVLSPPK